MDELPLLRQYLLSELKIRSEFLSPCLSFISKDLCDDCVQVLSDRIRSLGPEDSRIELPVQSPLVQTASPRKRELCGQAVDTSLSEEDSTVTKTPKKPKLSTEQREKTRFMNVKRLKDFVCMERVRGRTVNILEGLELHTDVFSSVEQKRIIDYVYELQTKGRKGELKGRTYSAPQKWMRGKGRVTLQFGCCYNYATDKAGNRPGILKHEMVDPIPNLFKTIIRRLVQWHVLPPNCVPDSCIVNIYEEGDCIPPHIDNHDFVRPFCTISFLSECNILFGSNLKIEGPGEFSGSYAIPLPVGSVLVLKGNGADVAKHCVPAVPTKRISITFRKMDESKRPFGFIPEPDLQGIQPLQDCELNTTSSASSSRFDHGDYSSQPQQIDGKPVATDYDREWSNQRRRPRPPNHGSNSPYYDREWSSPRKRPRSPNRGNDSVYYDREWSDQRQRSRPSNRGSHSVYYDRDRSNQRQRSTRPSNHGNNSSFYDREWSNQRRRSRSPNHGNNSPYYDRDRSNQRQRSTRPSHHGNNSSFYDREWSNQRRRSRSPNHENNWPYYDRDRSNQRRRSTRPSNHGNDSPYYDRDRSSQRRRSRSPNHGNNSPYYDRDRSSQRRRSRPPNHERN